MPTPENKCNKRDTLTTSDNGALALATCRLLNTGTFGFLNVPTTWNLCLAPYRCQKTCPVQQYLDQAITLEDAQHELATIHSENPDISHTVLISEKDLILHSRLSLDEIRAITGEN